MYLNLLPFSILCTMVIAELTSVSKMLVKFKLVYVCFMCCSNFSPEKCVTPGCEGLSHRLQFPGSMIYIRRGKALRLGSKLGILDRSPCRQFLLFCKLGLHAHPHPRRCTGCYWSLKRLSLCIIESFLRTQDRGLNLDRKVPIGRSLRTWTGKYQ